MYGSKTARIQGVKELTLSPIAPAAAVACLWVLALVPSARADRQPGAKTVGARPVTIEAVPVLPVRLRTMDGPTGRVPGPRGPCAAVTTTYATTNFTGTFNGAIPPGMVETEIAAVSFTIPPEDFPFVLDLTEIIFAQSHFNTTVTGWSYLVWEGLPPSNLPIATFSSDGGLIPHVVLPVGAANVVNLQVSVDPGDPGQIIVMNNGTNTFSVGFRIDSMNNPPTQSCISVCPLLGPCILPAECCPPDELSNAWPAMDDSGPEFGMQNWLFARDCIGALSCCFLSSGWHRFSEFGPSAPLNDWAIQVTYTPVTCAAATGACCNPNGACTDDLTEADCLAAGGVFQGANVTCTQVEPCPAPTGACCFGPFNCLNFTESDCNLAAGTWQGAGTACVPVTGECPLGACCLPDGTCADDTSAVTCAAMSGVYQGDLTNCAATSCPQPTGACCLSNGSCLELTLTDCGVIPGSNWSGPLTTCPGTCCAGPNGDINGDGLINGPDVAAFVAAVLGTPTPVEICRGDFSGMNGLDPGDIPGLVAALLAP